MAARGRDKSGAGLGIQPGAVLDGKYRIEGTIGKGGMAVVAMARHIELGQRVAIKLLPPDQIKDKELVQRFMREAQAAVRLRTEHAVKVSDVGKQKNGAPYMVMELLEGEDLARVIARRPFPIPAAVECVLQTCEAVAEAHAMGMVHRDLKLKNLFLISRQPDRPFVKVLDFGLVKDVALMDDAAALTATTAVLGSPHYMSPEQMRASRDVDAKTDIWALGVCLYELIAGRPPFPGDTVAVVCAAVLKQEPIPLPSVIPTVPPELWDVIARCLRKNPDERFQSVVDLARAIEPFAPTHAQGAAARMAKMQRALPTVVFSGAKEERRAGLGFGVGVRGLSERTLFVLSALVVFALVTFIGVLLIMRVRHEPTTRAPAHHYEPDPPIGFAPPHPLSKASNASEAGDASVATPNSFNPPNAKPNAAPNDSEVGDKHHQLKLGPSERM